MAFQQPYSILIVDDEEHIRKLLKLFLKKEGWIVEEASDGINGLFKAMQYNYSMILLDRNMPGMDGLEFCRELKKKKSTPVIMLSACGEEDDRLDGFQAGSDDYVVKPFSPRELMYRIKAIIRRTSEFAYRALQRKQTPDLTLPGLVFDYDSRQVIAGNSKVKLTFREYELLRFMAANINQPISREDLMRRIWGYQSLGDYRTIDTHVKRIREKLNRVHPESASLIQTVWGIGYCLMNPAAETI